MAGVGRETDFEKVVARKQGEAAGNVVVDTVQEQGPVRMAVADCRACWGEDH